NDNQRLIETWMSYDVAICVFTSLASLSDAVMEIPDKSLCFKHRLWTVVLVSSVKWAAKNILYSKKLKLHDSRIHWIVMDAWGTESVLSTLPYYLITHRITWLRWTLRTKGWIVLSSKATSSGLVAREVGRWKNHTTKVKQNTIEEKNKNANTSMQELEGNKYGSILTVVRPLQPPHTQNFFQKRLRVISRRDTDPEMVVNTVGRCYYNSDGSTSCTGYVGEMLETITKSLNLSISNRMVKSCGVANSEGTRVTVIAND
ncbi:hypothetical protein SK128_028034, partial [Halocaridina rubra]